MGRYNLDQEEILLQGKQPSAPPASPLRLAPETKPRFNPVRMGLLLAVLTLVLGFLHIVKGSKIGYTVIPRLSFGYSEMVIDVDEITTLPYLVAKSKYPLSIAVLQKERLIESDQEFAKRAMGDVQRLMDEQEAQLKRKLDALK